MAVGNVTTIFNVYGSTASVAPLYSQVKEILLSNVGLAAPPAPLYQISKLYESVTVAVLSFTHV